MSNTTLHTADVAVAADVETESPNEKFFTVEDVAHMLAHNGAASNGNGNGNGTAAATPPAGVATRLLSGRYEGTSAPDAAGDEFSLELRLDVDGKRPTAKVSGDFFKKSGGGVLRYWGSFLVASPKIEIDPVTNEVTVKGTAEYYGQNKKGPNVLVTIPRPPVPGQPPKVTFSDDAGAEEKFDCKFSSPFFRTVEYEIDNLEGTQVFDSYDTNSFPSGGPRRTLSVVTAYAEAGIEMVPSAGANVIPKDVNQPFGGFDGKWSDAEIHSSMLTHFSLLDGAAQDDPEREGQWKLWMLVATEHVQSDMRGIMFDHWWNRHRQGCAVFYNVINRVDKKDPDENGLKRRRGALRTYVHEMGHCFNLIHSWEKSTAHPPIPNRPRSLSYMNYVSEFPGGANLYWEKFAFEFDDPELLHLRHAFRDRIIMGGDAFGTEAAEIDSQVFSKPAGDSGLCLRLESRKSFMLCEPVAVELKLSRKSTHCCSKSVRQSIHPDRGFVQIAIRKPDGRVVSYRPLASRCAESELTVLDCKQPSLYASAYIGYGRDGFYFDQTGFYQLVAVYYSPCGAEVVSPPLTLRVRNPHNEVEEEIADLYYGHDQGALFYLLGSDSEYLSSGNRSLDNVLDKYPDHPLSIHALVVKGVNDGRRFKTITREKSLTARAPRADDSRKLLSNIVDPTMKGAGFFRRLWNRAGGGTPPAAGVPRLDNITLNMCARRLATAKRRLGDQSGAETTMKEALEYFRRAGLKEHVLKVIEDQARRTLTEKY